MRKAVGAVPPWSFHTKHDTLFAMTRSAIWVIPALLIAAVAVSQDRGTARTVRPSGEQVMDAIAQAYPERVRDVQWRYGDWAVNIDGTWFHWQGGRLLPEAALDNGNTYAAHRFYRYPSGRAVMPVVSEDQAAELLRRFDEANRNPPSRHMGLLDVLYRIHDREDAEHLTEWIHFLGHRVRVHTDLVRPLKRVEMELKLRALDNPKLNIFFEQLVQIDGYNWRYIAGTRSRSYHSYGAAVDLIPRQYGNRFTYWRWAVDAGVSRWWEIPFSRRWMIPYTVVEVFEKEGFIWGGKWLYFDTMHFEYRPELQILAGWRS